MSVALVSDKFLRNPLKFHSMKKNLWSVTGPKVCNALNLFTVELSQYHKSGSIFFLKCSGSCHSLSGETAVSSEKPCFYACTSNQPKLYMNAAPRARLLILESKPLQMSFGIDFWSGCQMTVRGLSLGSNLNSAACPTSCNDFICCEIPE